jgi:hypothetical protein
MQAGLPTARWGLPRGARASAGGSPLGAREGRSCPEGISAEGLRPRDLDGIVSSRVSVPRGEAAQGDTGVQRGIGHEAGALWSSRRVRPASGSRAAESTVSRQIPRGAPLAGQ